MGSVSRQHQPQRLIRVQRKRAQRCEIQKGGRCAGQKFCQIWLLCNLLFFLVDHLEISIYQLFKVVGIFSILKNCSNFCARVSSAIKAMLHMKRRFPWRHMSQFFLSYFLLFMLTCMTKHYPHFPQHLEHRSIGSFSVLIWSEDRMDGQINLPHKLTWRHFNPSEARASD